jgi:hypothetical protein
MHSRATSAARKADLGTLAARRTQVEQDRAATARQLDIATQAVHVSETQLAVLVRALYERPTRAIRSPSC